MFPIPSPRCQMKSEFPFRRNSSPVPMTPGQSEVGPSAGTQWLLVLPFIGLNARFKLAVLWKGREAADYIMQWVFHTYPPPPSGKRQNTKSRSPVEPDKERQHPVFRLRRLRSEWRRQCEMTSFPCAGSPEDCRLVCASVR